MSSDAPAEGTPPGSAQTTAMRGDLTGGPVFRTLMLFSVPMLLSNILQSLSGTINSIWVGRLIGEDALAATANANIIMFLVAGAAFGFGMAATVRPRRQGTFGVGPWEKVQDFSLYDRCITRGLVGSFGPAVYGNGARFMQTPDALIISYEMVHDTRIIPFDDRPVLSENVQLYMGSSRGRWEGDTLVVESTNFTDKTAVGGIRHSASARIIERFTRVDPEMIDYQVTINDPETFTKPWTFRWTITSQPGYQIYEYSCHEGNVAMRNSLSAERAYEREAAENARKGLPPPERVFEKVNGEDRGR